MAQTNNSYYFWYSAGLSPSQVEDGKDSAIKPNVGNPFKLLKEIISISLAVIVYFGLVYGLIVGASSRLVALGSKSPSDNQALTENIQQAKANINLTPAIAAQKSQDLQGIVEQWRKDYPNPKYGVAVQELGGNYSSAELNVDYQFNSASLYKLFLIQYLYHLQQESKIKLESPSTLKGYTYNDCIGLMITISNNDCGLTLGSKVGWANLNKFISNQGYSQTSTNPTVITSAHDIALFLAKLYENNLLSNRSDNALVLSYMKQQSVKYAIPEGLPPGVEVADKIGSSSTLWHDAAIVYGPKSTYILVVLSENSGSGPLKDLSSRIYHHLNP